MSTKHVVVDNVVGTVFDTQRFSVHDGHGIRTLVFLKGCPLRCQWCSNPESQRFAPQIAFYPDKCVACFGCAAVCPNGDRFKTTQSVDWERCIGCLKCVDRCLYEARKTFGVEMTVGEVFAIVARDRVFYENSGGGLTLGGGEATAQPEFARALLKKCREENIHTALETCGFVSSAVFDSIVEHVDLLLFDLKHMDSNEHRAKTGVPNTQILENAQRASTTVQEMIVRLPLIPGFNDTEKNIRATGAFVRGRMPRVRRIDVLPYHSVGESKMAAIGGEYRYSDGKDISDARLEHVKGLLQSYGLTVSIGG